MPTPYYDSLYYRQHVDSSMPKSRLAELRERAERLGGSIRESDDFDTSALYVLTDGNDVVKVMLDGLEIELDRWDSLDKR